MAPINDNLTIDEKLEYFKNCISNKIIKCYLVGHMIELHKSYIHKLDSIRKIINEIFLDMTLPNEVMDNIIEIFKRYNHVLGSKGGQLLGDIETNVRYY